MTAAKSVALISVLLLGVGCHKHYQPLLPPALGPSMSRLTSALQAELGRYPNEALVAETLKKKPELELDFRQYEVRTRSSGTRLVVLVCTKDGKRALMEDASWTPRVDKRWYEVTPAVPCEFTIEPRPSTTGK